MPPTLKTELGLGDKKGPSNPQTNQGSTEQADKFKAAYQAQSSKINESLQYTAAYAEKAKHDPLATKRETLCQAYQVALQRIDPKNPAVAQSAIDQVLSSAQQLQTSTATLKTAAEKAYNAWTARQGDLERMTDEIREMNEWGHAKAAPLQSVLEAINGKANERAYEEALKALDQLGTKEAPIYEDYKKQKAAQEEYEPALMALEPRLGATQTCSFKSLQERSQQLATDAGKMRESATAKDYVSALAALRTLEGNVDAFEKALEELQAKKQQYEEAKGGVDTKQSEADQYKFKVLEEFNQPIADLKTASETAATDEKYDDAVTKVGELTTKLDEKIQKGKTIEEKKKEYEQLSSDITRRLPTQSEADFPSLEPLQTEMTGLQDQMVQAAEAEDYENAVTHANSLKTKLEEYEQQREKLEKAKQEYEQLSGDLLGRMPNQCEADFPTLEPLQTELSTLKDQMTQAADAKDYEKALEHANNLKTKLEDYERIRSELETKKAEYDKLSAAAMTKVKETGLTAKAIDSLDAQKVALQPLQKAMEASAAAKDWDKALADAQALDAAAQKYLDAVAKIEKETKKTTDEMNKELDGLSGVAKKEKAREWAKKLTPDQLKTMSQDDRNRLMKELTDGGVSQADKDALNQIYKVRALDPEYEKAAVKNREDFLKKLNEDPDMAEARKNWTTWSDDKRMEVLKKVAKVHTEVYGTEKIDGEPDLTVVPVNNPPTSNGVYNPTTGVMGINTNPNATSDGIKPKFQDFDRAMDLVDHEANHRYQSMLAKKLAAGKLDKNDPMYKQAEAFMYNDKYYASAKNVPDYDMYQNQPQESASRVSGAIVEKAKVGSKDHGHDEHDHHH